VRRLVTIVVVAGAALLIPPAPQAAANALPYHWLPWTRDESRVVTQGNNQGPSHTGNLKYAWDFAAGVNNWLVRAARGGVVAAYVDGNSTGGCARRFNKYTNYVNIDTGDGYETLYAHLQYGSAGSKVSVGQRVFAYTPIGNTDSTGYVCGTNPDHLHYQVETPCSGIFCTSVSSSFLDPDVLQQRPDGIPRKDDTPVSGNHIPWTDLFLYNATSGAWDVEFANGAGYWTYGGSGAGWSTGWQVYPGFYNGDSYTDVLLYNAGNGAWNVQLASGAGAWTYGGSGTWAPNRQLYTGSYNADGYTDVLSYRSSLGVWNVLMASGSGNWASTTGGTWSTGWAAYPGDYNND
jgi:murein DD-endopeptidase MepM/ murein hydrolase activator NlpD